MQIIEDLPKSLQQDVKKKIFKKIIERWTNLLGAGSNAIVNSMIIKLKIEVQPKNEYIIKFGEIGTQMYFIVSGKVSIKSQEGVELA